MRTFVLHCENLLFREQAHAHLAQALELPAYYGKNLDALYDCLTELGPCTIQLVDAALLRRDDGYGALILQTLADAARDDPRLHLEEL